MISAPCPCFCGGAKWGRNRRSNISPLLLSGPLGSWVFFTCFCDHTRRLRLEKLLHLELFKELLDPGYETVPEVKRFYIYNSYMQLAPAVGCQNRPKETRGGYLALKYLIYCCFRTYLTSWLQHRRPDGPGIHTTLQREPGRV
jgi:hypothetical protein